MDDAISRKAAIEEIARWMGYIDEDMILRIQTGLKKLPSVQPEKKTGHWIGIDDEPCDVYECDQCGATYDTVGNTWDLPYFCPDCGSDMRPIPDQWEEEEDE